MQFRFAHRPFESQKQTVVEVGGIVDSILVDDQRIPDDARFDEALRVAAAASEPRDLDADDDAGAAEADLADQTLKADALMRALPGTAEIVIDDEDLLFGPTEFAGALGKGILPFGAFPVSQDLLKHRLTDVNIGVALQMRGEDFRGCRQHVVSPFSC